MGAGGDGELGEHLQPLLVPAGGMDCLVLTFPSVVDVAL